MYFEDEAATEVFNDGRHLEHFHSTRVELRRHREALGDVQADLHG